MAVPTAAGNPRLAVSEVTVTGPAVTVNGSVLTKLSASTEPGFLPCACTKNVPGDVNVLATLRDELQFCSNVQVALPVSSQVRSDNWWVGRPPSPGR